MTRSPVVGLRRGADGAADSPALELLDGMGVGGARHRASKSYLQSVQ